MLAQFAFALAFNLPAAPLDEFVQTDVFVSGEEGYNTYRIPSLIVTPKGTLLAFCEGRKRGPATRATSTWF